MFKGVLFDLDGVLTDTAKFHFAAWQKLAAELAIPFDQKFNEQLKGLSRVDSLQIILEHATPKVHVTPAEFQQLTDRKNRYYLAAIESLTPQDVLPGIVSLLTKLNKRQIKIALASASQNGPEILKKLALLPYFDAIADPKQITRGKPAPDIFKLAAKLINESPKDCFAIEDSKAGIAAILASGAQPIGVGLKKELGPEISVVATTNELTFDYLQQIWQAK